MSGFEAMPHDTYALVHEMTRKTYAGQAWPVELVVLHLRWLVGERTIGRLSARDFPTVRGLADEWGWTRWRVDTFIRNADAWQDPLRRVGLDWLRGERTRATAGQDQPRTGQDHDKQDRQTPTVDAKSGQDQPRTGQEPDSRARSSSGSPITLHPDPEENPPRKPEGELFVLASPPEKPAIPSPIPAWLARSKTPKGQHATMLDAIRRIREAVLGDTLTCPPERWKSFAAPALALWESLGRPEPATFADDVALVTEWARESGEPLARNDLRGIRPDGSEWGADRTRDVETLCRQAKWDARLDAARSWDHRGRCDVLQAAPAGRHGQEDDRSAGIARLLNMFPPKERSNA